MDNKNLVIGVLSGVAVGAILGVLFAPDKGSETRKKISNKSSDAYNGVKDKLSSLMGDVSEKIENGKANVKEFAREAKTV